MTVFNSAAMRPALANRALLVVPALILLFCVFAYPVGSLLLRSLSDPVWGLQNFRAIIEQPVYFNALVNTVGISGSVTLICLLAGYPLAYTIAQASGRMQRLLIFSVLIPFWSSILVRTFAWLVILQHRGLVNRAIVGLGIVDAPITMVHNRIGVLAGMVHILLPFMVLPLYSVMKSIPPTYQRAAVSLGSHPFAAFWRVYVPQTYPGVGAGVLLVFILSIGYYITPALLGGPSDQMVSYYVAYFTNVSINWGMACALGALLLAATTVLYFVYGRFTRTQLSLG